MQRKIWAAADFQNFLARPNTRRPRKKEVRKRRASIYRTSPSDAVDYFLVSHVITGIVVIDFVISQNRKARRHLNDAQRSLACNCSLVVKPFFNFKFKERENGC